MKLRAVQVVAAVVLLVVWSLSDAVSAQIVTNIEPTQTTPLDLGTEVDTVGTTTEITGGTRPNNGTNLFHSFDFFTLGTGDTARFLNDMQRPTNNIFGRVIGGEASTIDGTLQTNNPLNAADPMNFGAANLWLVNPSGLLLGPNARVDVGGSVSMSTADYLRFDGTSTLFDMLSTSASLGQLSVAPVVAFGFTGPGLPSPITVQGSMLQVPEGKSLSLVGGDITIQDGTLEDGTIQAANLLAPGGRLNLVSVASSGEVLVPSFQTDSFTSMGTVMLKDGATLDVSGQLDEFGIPIGNGNSGTVFVRGGQLVMDASTTVANTVGTMDANVIGQDIHVTGDLILRNVSTILAQTINARGPGIQITAGRLQVLNGSQIGTFTRGSGNGGPIDVRANSLLISGVDLSDGAPSSLVSRAIGTAASGTSGNIRAQADSVVVEEGGLIRADLAGGSPGDAGNIDMTAGTVDISTRGLIAADADEGTGPAGQIAITANDVRIVGDGTVDPFSAWLGSNRGFDFPTDLPTPPEWFDATGITTSTNAGGGGGLTLKADTLAITDNGAMTSRTIGSGDAGTIDLQIADNVTLINGGIVSASTSGTGVGGNVSVGTDTLMLSDGGILSSSTFGVVPEAAAGTIRVDATTVSLAGGSQIASDSFGPGVSGAIHITAGDLVTLTGTSADGLTPTLMVTNHITAGDLVTLTGTSADGLTPTPVVTNAQATGKLGDIVVQTKNLTASGGAHVRTESLGSRTAGSIHVKATETVSLAGTSADGVFGSGLFANTVSPAADAGDGGNITVEAKNLTLEGSAQIASGSFGSGDGGTINVTVAETLTIAGTSADVVFASGLFTNASGSGKSGNIFVTTKYLSAEGGGQISTSSFGSGTSGDIRVTATELLTLKGRSPSSPTERDGSWPSGVVASAESGASDAGDAGNIVVEAKELIIEGGAGILSASFGPGAGGAIKVTATEAVTLTGVGTVGDTVFASSVSTASESESTGAGDAGNLALVTKHLTLSEGAQITSASSGPGAGGNINVRVARMTMDNGGTVSAASSGTSDAGNITILSSSTFVMENSKVTTGASQASGGQITINAPEMVRLIDSQVSTSVAGSDVDTAGGNITIDPQFVILQNSQVIAQANAGEGGDISIIAGAFLADPSSLVSASSERGISGEVNIQSQIQNLGEQLTPLSEAFSSAAALLAQQCAARVVDGKFSTFVVAGREGFPVEPGGYIASPSLTAALLGSNLSGRYPPTSTPAGTGAFPLFDAKPIQLAKLGGACHH